MGGWSVLDDAVDSFTYLTNHPPTLPLQKSAIETRSPATCAVHFPWWMLYGEHRVLKPPPSLLLLDAYRRVCEVTEATKVFFRPEWVDDTHMLPHYLSCKVGGWVGGWMGG